jgi:hypothetical protein
LNQSLIFKIFQSFDDPPPKLRIDNDARDLPIVIDRELDPFGDFIDSHMYSFESESMISRS